jgi:hypothetical protein
VNQALVKWVTHYGLAMRNELEAYAASNGAIWMVRSIRYMNERIVAYIK